MNYLPVCMHTFDLYAMFTHHTGVLNIWHDGYNNTMLCFYVYLMNTALLNHYFVNSKKK